MPRLSDGLSDPHTRVQAAARTALHEVRCPASHISLLELACNVVSNLAHGMQGSSWCCLSLSMCSVVRADTRHHNCKLQGLCERQVGSVIRNPEVAALVPALLAAISEPNKNTRATLDTLLDTVFINTVDAASLALIVPVVNRGLRERAGDTKKKAARIVGNMCALINEPKVRPTAFLITKLCGTDMAGMNMPSSRTARSSTCTVLYI